MRFIRLPIIACENEPNQYDDELLQSLQPEPEHFNSEVLVNISDIIHVIQGKEFCTIYFISGDSVNVYKDLVQIERLLQ